MIAPLQKEQEIFTRDSCNPITFRYYALSVIRSFVHGSWSLAQRSRKVENLCLLLFRNVFWELVFETRMNRFENLFLSFSRMENNKENNLHKNLNDVDANSRNFKFRFICSFSCMKFDIFCLVKIFKF